MKSTLLKTTLLAIVLVGVTSCKNSGKETELEIEAPAEASETASEYIVDTAASQILWEGSKPGTIHHGTVGLSSGVLLVNEGELEAGNFVIDMNTITDEDLEGEYKTNLEAHLKGTVEGKEGDFFDVQKYPTATFELVGVTGNKVTGNLTIKEKTNMIEFPAGIQIDGDTLTISSEPFELDRTKWDVNFGSKSIFPSIGDKFIGDSMKITINIKAKKA